MHGKAQTFATNYLTPIAAEAEAIYDRLGNGGEIARDDIRLLAQATMCFRVVLIGLAREIDELRAQDASR